MCVRERVRGARGSVGGVDRKEGTREPVALVGKVAHVLEERLALVIYPRLATGGSMVATIDMLKKAGCSQIRALVLVAAPEGIRKVQEAHPDVSLYTASVDQGLNEEGYIIPGLGDAGDKIFGTK